MSESRMPPIWPDVALEAEMLADAGPTDTNVGCHVRALLVRIRELESTLKATGYFHALGSLPALIQAAPNLLAVCEAILGAAELDRSFLQADDSDKPVYDDGSWFTVNMAKELIRAVARAKGEALA